MTTLEKLNIKNFRGFDALEINGLSKINLFVGKNNSGKTSILEALFLLIGMSNPLLPNSINKIRGLNISSANQLKYLFHNLKFENKPFFSGKFNDGSERELEIHAKCQQKNDFPSILSSAISTSEIIGIDLNFWDKKKDAQKVSRKSSTTFDNRGMDQTSHPNDYKEKLSATYISPEKDDLGVLVRYSEIIKRNEGDFILQTLKTFDNNIVNIQLLPDGVYFKLKDVNELVPSSIMGDGIRRFLNIVTAVSEKQNAFVCIDEIENGLHYSAYKWLWKSLLSFSEQNEVQLFITTHNIETLACLKYVLEDVQFENMRAYSKVFAVSKTMKSAYKAYGYSYKEFKTAMENDIELRK
jgi:AAA15 family ATPase/GTPase